MSTIDSALLQGNDDETYRNEGQSAEPTETAGHGANPLASLDYHLRDIRGRIENLEAVVAREADFERAVENLLANVEALEAEVEAERARVDDLEARIETIESIFSGRLVEGERAHVDAQKRDPDEIVSVGEERTLYVEETLYDQPEPQAVGRIEGLVVFVDLDERREDLADGGTLEIVITDLGDTCAHAVPATEVTSE